MLLLSPIEISFIVLIPNRKEVSDRNASRADDLRLPETTLRSIYDDMCGSCENKVAEIIVNSNLAVAQTVSEIDQILKSQSN
jgi:hypothetical protein